MSIMQELLVVNKDAGALRGDASGGVAVLFITTIYKSISFYKLYTCSRTSTVSTIVYTVAYCRNSMVLVYIHVYTRTAVYTY